MLTSRKCMQNYKLTLNTQVTQRTIRIALMKVKPSFHCLDSPLHKQNDLFDNSMKAMANYIHKHNSSCDSILEDSDNPLFYKSRNKEYAPHRIKYFGE